MDLSTIRIDASPLTNTIRIGRVGAKPGVYLDKRDATGECIGAVIEHVMHGCPDGATLSVTAPDGRHYDLTVKPVQSATPSA
ncbi:DUF7446 family protein [Azospirillum sp.]|uniref:DUF7446 family protein n=1 Tax=Azospirillum sp. TaxID=34012 RepID=UPI002D7195E6|nr:hypothetical protein [Azospirillum sp.]HYF89016.1 hypothetical protein [Azospirillum sp.]